MLACKLPLATDILFLKGSEVRTGQLATGVSQSWPWASASRAPMYLGVSIGHQSDIENLIDHQPRGEQLSDQEEPAATAQGLVVETHVDRW